MGYSGLGKQTFYPSMPKCHTGTFLAYIPPPPLYFFTKCFIIDLICITPAIKICVQNIPKRKQNR